MAEIIEFKPRQDEQELIWQCLCGGQSYLLCKGGAIECTECHGVVQGIRWFFPDGEPD